MREELGRLTAELKRLYRAAGEPTEEGLAEAVKSRPQGGPITDSTISSWLRGQYAPSQGLTGQFMALIDVLKKKAKGAPSTARSPMVSGVNC